MHGLVKKGLVAVGISAALTGFVMAEEYAGLVAESCKGPIIELPTPSPSPTPPPGG